MKTHSKLILSLVLVAVLSYCLNAIPPGTGSKHIRFTGYEEVVIPPQPTTEPGWLLLTTRHNLVVPSMKGEVIELIIEWTYQEVAGPNGTFTMYGAGPILDAVGGNVIGSASFMNRGQYLAPPPLLEWYADGTVVGTIWGGDYAGMVLTENVTLDALIDFTGGLPGEAVRYDSIIDGFLLVSDNVQD